MKANFLLGEIVMTEEARQVLQRLPFDLLARHAVNDHGSVTEQELASNLHSVMNTMGVVRSRYKANPTAERSAWVLIETVDTWSKTRISLE